MVTEEEQIEGLSFGAYIRTATHLHLPAQGVASATHQMLPVSGEELAAAHAADSRPAGTAPADDRRP